MTSIKVDTLYLVIDYGRLYTLCPRARLRWRTRVQRIGLRWIFYHLPVPAGNEDAWSSFDLRDTNVIDMEEIGNA